MADQQGRTADENIAPQRMCTWSCCQRAAVAGAYLCEIHTEAKPVTPTKSDSAPREYYWLGGARQDTRWMARQERLRKLLGS
jgi:hypothetical protein